MILDLGFVDFVLMKAFDFRAALESVRNPKSRVQIGRL